MTGRRVAIAGAIAGMLVMASGTVGYGMGRGDTPTGGVPPVARNESGAGASASGFPGGAEPAMALDRAGMTVAPDFPGTFYPGQPPAAPGLHAAGVAYRKVSGADDKPDADLVRKAYDDAVGEARELAAASGVTLGKLVAIADAEQTQPHWKACEVRPMEAPAAPDADAKAVAPDGVASMPAPEPCEPEWYAVAWVHVTFELA